MASLHGNAMSDNKMKVEAQHGQVWSSNLEKHNYDKYSHHWFHVGEIFVDDEYSRRQSFWFKIS